MAVFCLVDDWLEGNKLRQRGPYPELSDSEVLTIEIVGEHLGIDTDEGLYTYFRRHYAEWFPVLRGVHRTTFTRQSANLWDAKKELQKHLLDCIGFDPEDLLDRQFPGRSVPLHPGLPLPKVDRRIGLLGYEETRKQTFYGLRAHLLVCWPGVIVGVDLAPAGVHDLGMAEELLLLKACSSRRGGSWAIGITGAPISPSGSGTRG